MKTILSFLTVALVALGMSVSTAQAKNKGSTPKKPDNKKPDKVDAYLKQHDKDKNGTIEASEYQGSKEDFAKWDKNSDGKLDRTELGDMLSKK